MKVRIAFTSRFYILILIWSFSLPSSFAGPAFRNLKYEEGKTYLHEFETSASTSLPEIATDTQTFEIKGTAALTVESGCTFVLVVTKASLKTSKGQVSKKIGALEGSFTRFENQDGLLTESISVNPQDPVWSANIKRALISLFNNAPISNGIKNLPEITFIENDVSGSKCNTKYSISNSKYVKYRDLNRCGSRDGGFSASQGILYSLEDGESGNQNEYVSSTLVQSSQTCEQDFKNGLLNSVQCTETHKTQDPVSSVVSEVKASIKYITTQENNGNVEILKNVLPTSHSMISTIYFDHNTENNASTSTESKDRILAVFDKLCEEISPTGTLSAEVPSAYIDLQIAISKSTAVDLDGIYQSLKSESNDNGTNKCKKKQVKLFLDACVTIASTGTIEFVSNLLLQQRNHEELPERVESLFIFYLAFAQNPGEQALQSILPLLTSSNNTKLVLGASGLAHQFCKSTANCGFNEQYKKLVDTIAAIVGENLSPESQSIKGVAITGLQALGNLDSLTQKAITVINVALASTDDKLKIHALQAFRRDPCQEKLKAATRRIFENGNLNSAIRIHAYLALARCLSVRDTSFMSNVLRKENVKQVKAFIETHRANALYSTRPTFSERLKNFYKNIETSRESPAYDPRKYSTNFETTSFNEESNSGYSVETNLIYSQHSFVPKTIAGNFSVYHVGKAYNLFEFGLNLADVEYWAEKLFGPKSKSGRTAYSKEPVFTPKPSNKVNKDLVTFDQKNINRLQDQVQLSPSQNNDPSDIYLRIFGTTVYAELVELEGILGTSSNPNANLLSPVAKLIQAFKTGQKIDLTEPIPLFSNELRIPTISGLPIHCQIKSLAIASLEWNNQIENGWKSIATKLVPSSTLLIRAKMNVGDGQIIESGLSLEMKAHQSGAIEFKSKLDSTIDGTLAYETKLTLPDQKIKFLELKSEVFWVETVDGLFGNKKKEVETTLPMRVNLENQCSARIGQYLGIAACTNIKLPAVPTDGSLCYLGQSELSFYIEKTDLKLTEYILKLDYGIDGNSDPSFSVLIDTPGSTSNRKININGKLKGEKTLVNHLLDIQIETPWKNIQITDEMSSSPADDSTQHTFIIKFDGKEYKVSRSSSWKQNKLSDNSITTTRSSVLIYKSPNSVLELYKLDYKNAYDLNGSGLTSIKTEFDVQMNIPLIRLDGKISGVLSATTKVADGSNITPSWQWHPIHYREHEIQSISISKFIAATSYGRVEIDGSITQDPTLITVQARYGPQNNPDPNALHIVSLSLTCGGIAAEDSTAELKLLSSQFPGFNVDSVWKSSFSGSPLGENSFSFDFAQFESAKKDVKSFNLGLCAEAKNSKEESVAKVNFRVASPKNDIDIHLNLNGFSNIRNASSQLEFKFGSLVQTNAKLNIDKVELEYDFELKNEIGGTVVVLESSYDDRRFKGLLHIQPDRFYVEILGTHDRIVTGQQNVENVQVSFNSSALSAAEVLKFSYDMESTTGSTRLIVHKATVNLAFGSTNLVNLFVENTENKELNLFIAKLLETRLKVGPKEPGNARELMLSFFGKWIPSLKTVSFEGASNAKGRNQMDLDITFKFNDDIRSIAYSLNSFAAIDAETQVLTSKKVMNMNGQQSQLGIVVQFDNKELRGKPSLELTLTSSEGKKYNFLVSTESKRKIEKKLLHFLYDIDLKVDLPNRKPINVLYLAELQYDVQDAKSPKCKLVSDYQSIFNDEAYRDTKLGINFETKLRSGVLLPENIVLEVNLNSVKHKFNFVSTVDSGKKHDLNFKVQSVDSKAGKLFDGNLQLNHERIGRKDQLGVISSFEINGDHEITGSSSFNYTLREGERTPRGPLNTVLEFREEGTFSITKGNEEFEFSRNNAILLDNNDIHIKYEDIFNNKALNLVVPNFELIFHREESSKEDFDWTILLQTSKAYLQKVAIPSPSVPVSDVSNDNELCFVRVDIELTRRVEFKNTLTYHARQSFTKFLHRNVNFRLENTYGYGQNGFGNPVTISTIKGDVDGKNFEIESSLDVNRDRIRSDLSIKYGDAFKRLHLTFTNPSSLDRNIHPSFDIELQWGPSDSQKLASTATWISDSHSNSITCTFDTPALVGSPWKLDISTIEKVSYVISLDLKSTDSRFVKFKSSVLLKPSETLISASHEVNLPNSIDGKSRGSLDISRQGLILTHEYLKNDEMISNVTIKVSENEYKNIHIEASYCGRREATASTADRCDTLDIAFRKTTYFAPITMFHIIGERNGLKTGFGYDFEKQMPAQIWYPSNSGKQHTIGLLIYGGKASASDLHYVKSDVPSEPDFITKFGLQLILSERTVELSLVRAIWENREADAEANEIGLWLNKKNKPDERIGFGVARIGADVVNEKDQGKDIILYFGHPKLMQDLQKNLRIATKYRYGASNRVFLLQSEFDLFKRPDDKLRFEIQLNHKVLEDDHNLVFAIDIIAESKGQGIGYESHCSDIKQYPKRSAKCVFKFLSPNEGEKTYELNYIFRDLLEFKRTDKNGAQSYIYFDKTKLPSATVSDPFDGDSRTFPQYKAKLQLPGMTDYRIFDDTHNTENPFGYSFRTYPSSSPNQYTELWIGRVSATEYGLGLASVDQSNPSTKIRKNIVQVTNPKSSDLVFTLRFGWDKETIRDVLTRFQTRVTSTTSAMAEFVAKDDPVTFVPSQAGFNFGDALPDSTSMITWNLQQLSQILREQDIPNESVTVLRNLIEKIIQQLAVSKNEILDTRPPIPETLSIREGFAARINAYGQLINGVLQSVKVLLEKDIDSKAKPIYNKGMEDTYFTLIYEKFKPVVKIRDSIIELEETQDTLRTIITFIKQSLLSKFGEFYKNNVDDFNKLFPYQETRDFTRSLKVYMEKRILGTDKDVAIFNDFMTQLSLFLTKATQETIHVDMKSGVFQMSIPLFTKTKLARKFLRPSSVDSPPTGLPLKFWLDLLSNKVQALPPIEGDGLILGSSYFQSFDGVLKRFPTSCQYLLASDFANQNFTVALDLKLEKERDPSRSIIFTNHKDTVILTKDSNVYFNGALVSGNKNLGSFKTYRDKDWVTVRGDMGVLVGCALKMDVCVLRVNGFYFEKVRGVLGIMNNEEYDEYTLPTGKITESTDAFVKSWKLNSECPARSINKYLYDISRYIQMSQTIPLN